MKYFIANWKANKTFDEVLTWTDQFISLFKDNQPVIICPPHPFIIPLKERLKVFKNVFIGAQDLSRFEQGTYTGEVTAKNLSGLVSYVILGHSERRGHFSESDDILLDKFQLAQKYQIKTIYCIANVNQIFPQSAEFLCFEPVEAISTGNGKGENEPLTKILTVKSQLKLGSGTKFIYGG